MLYREPLPPDCPPPGASAIMEQTVRYRLLAAATPQPGDFDSFVKKRGQPNPQSDRTPCEQAGLSLYTTAALARNLLNSKFNRNGRWQSIGEITLLAGAGKCNPVEPDGHQTWWPSQDFHPTANCRVLL